MVNIVKLTSTNLMPFINFSANVLDLNASSVSTMCQEIIEESKCKPLLSLRVRNLPGDKLSIRKLTFL